MRTKACVITVVLVCVLFVNSGCPLRVRSLRLVFNQGTYGTYGFYSETDFSAFFEAEQQVGDDFRLPEGYATITQVRWWGA